MNQAERLDRTFAALAAPSRRAILAQLRRQEAGATVSALVKPLPIKTPAVMKHLDVLEDAGLITRSKDGRVVTVRLAPKPMGEAMAWLRRYERFWSAGLDRLTAQAEAQEAALKRDGK
jgi:DNA-binding transcriptional ArsR family regulator